MLIIQVFQSQPVFFVISMALLGMCIGSFLNVVIFRLPIMMQRDWHEQCCELLDIKNKDETEQEKLRAKIGSARFIQCSDKHGRVKLEYCDANYELHTIHM